MRLKNYYKIMGISRHDSQKAVKWAYEGLCRRYYPKDLADGQAKTEEQLENEKRMLEINEAYAVLSDPEKRRSYDERFFGPAESEWQGWAAGGQSGRASLQPDNTEVSRYADRTGYLAQIFPLGKIMALPLRTKLLFSVPVVALLAGILLGLNWAGAPASGSPLGPTEVHTPAAKEIPPEPQALISTTTSMTSSSPHAVVGSSITITAKVASSARTAPGAVQFKIDGSNLGSPMQLSDGQATLSLTSLDSGRHTVGADYVPQDGFVTSSSALVQTVYLTYDSFDTGYSGWKYFADGKSPEYHVQIQADQGNPGPAIKVGGTSTSGGSFGIQKEMDLSQWNQRHSLELSFDYRAVSSATSTDDAGSNLQVRIVDASTGKELLVNKNIAPPAGDFGWGSYAADISAFVRASPQIRIELSALDGGSGDRHELLFDNIGLASAD